MRLELRFRRAMVAAAAACATVGIAAPAQAAPKTQWLNILAFNDFHGNLLPPSSSNGAVTTDKTPTATGGPTATVPAGGAVYLASWLNAFRSQSTLPTLTLSGGDNIGASPPISGLDHDEATIEALNAMSLNASAVGNHELDEGATELLRIQGGGCHPGGCFPGTTSYPGARFAYLASNITKTSDAETLVDPVRVYKLKGIRIGVIGAILQDAPSVIAASSIAGLKFTAEAKAVNAQVAKLQRKGVHAFVLIVHDGFEPTDAPSLVNDCPVTDGPFAGVVRALSPEVGIVVSAHTHTAYNCKIGGHLVTQAMSYGRVITRFHVSINKKTGRFARRSAVNDIVTRNIAPDPTVQAILAKWAGLTAPVTATVVGRNTAAIIGDHGIGGSPAGETALGDLIADSQLDDTQGAGAQIAFMNPGGIRADLTYASSTGEGDGVITYGELAAIQPFSNTMVVMTLTGTQVEQALEEQWGGPQPPSGRILQVSKGFSYAWSPTRAPGDRIDPASIKLNGVALSPTGTYRVAVNNFLSTGGDNFVAFKLGTDRFQGDVDLDAFVTYVRKLGTVSPPALDRITQAP